MLGRRISNGLVVLLVAPAISALVPAGQQVAEAAVLCQKKRGGVVVRDPACKPKEMPLDPALLVGPLRVLSSGTATTLAPFECAFVFVFGVGGDTDANTIAAFHIVDANDQRVPSLDNEMAFEPGTVFKTSQGGTIA